MKRIILPAILFFLAACSQEPKNFSQVSTGMTKEEVLKKAGAPSSKNNIGLAELWVYSKSDRTVVFRKDTVFDIITSPHARIDSINLMLKQTGEDIKKDMKKAEDSLEKIGSRIKHKIKPDSTSKKK